MKRILDKFNQSAHFKKYFMNAGWLFFEQIIRLGISALTGIYIANYLGEARAGFLSYASVFLAFALPVATLGTNVLLVKELLLPNKVREKLLGTSFILRIAVSAFIFFAIAGYLFYINEPLDRTFIILAITASLFFQSFQIIESYFTAIVKAKQLVLAKTYSFVIITIAKLLFVYFRLPLIYFAIIFTVENILLAFFYIIFYHRKQKLSIFNWNFSFTEAKHLLKNSWVLILTGFLATLFIKADIYMIQKVMDDAANGNYNAATKISEMFYFLPSIICNTLFPAIIYGKNIGNEEYQRRLQKLFDLLTWVALAIIIPFALFSNFITHLLYNENKFHVDLVSQVLTIHVIAGLFVFWGSGYGRIFIVEKKNKLFIASSAIGGASNIILNIFLIPQFGILGAAIATLISYSIAYFFIILLSKERKRLISYPLRSFNLLRIYKSIFIK